MKPASPLPCLFKSSLFFWGLLFASLSFFRPSNADDVSWINTGTNTAWLTAGNWSTTVPGSNDVAIFNNTGSATFTGINMNTMSGSLTVQAIHMTSLRTRDLDIRNSAPSVAGVLILTGGTVNAVDHVILRNASGNNLTISHQVGMSGGIMGLALGGNTDNRIVVDGAGAINISSVISSHSGATPLTIMGNGSGHVEIQGDANTFTGGIHVLGSEARFTADGSLGNAANDIFIDGGRFATADAASYTLGSGRDIFVGDTAGTAISTTGAGSTLTYNGAIADITGKTGSWAKQGEGVLVLGGVSTYTGGTTINQGTLRLDAGGNRLPTGTVVSLGQAASANLGTFDLNGFNQEVAGLVSIAGTNAGSGKNTVTSAAPATLTLSGGGTYVYGDGTAANSGVLTGALAVVKTGGGTQIFGDANTYTGGTTVSGGTLLVNNASGSGTGTGSVLVQSGGTLGGSGFITGPTTILGIHAPGDAAGVLTHGDLAYGGGSSVQWELFGNTASLADRGALFDGINVGGTLDFTAAIPSFSLVFDGSGSTVNWEHALWGSTQTWLLYDMTGSGGITGWTDQILSPFNWLDGGGKAFNDYLFGSYFDVFEEADGDLYLRYNFAVIPEPSRALLISLGVLGLILRRRRP